MTTVLGVSVGASAVRFARRDTGSVDSPIFRSRSMPALLDRPAEQAAESIETMLAETDEIEQVRAIGVAYQNETQADFVQGAMSRLDIDNFRLVPEVTAALEMLETTGDLGDHETLVFYDLGSSGLTVTVVDRGTRIALSTARSEGISGDLVDRLIYDHHVDLQRFAEPTDMAAQRALTARCRDAKEQLSSKDAVCMPGEGGLLLLSQDSFDSLIDGPVKASARLTLDVIRRSGRTPDAAVLIGGGANIPLVTAVMESWLDIPVIVPPQPELVAAEGAALLARPDTAKVAETAEFAAPTELTETAQFAPQLVAPDAPTESFATADIRQETEAPAQPRNRRRLLLAGGAVVVAAAIALGVDLLQDSGRDPQPTATQQEIQEPPAQPAAEPRSTTPTDTSTAAETVPAVSDEQSTVTDRSETRTTYRPQTTAETSTTSTQVPATTGTQDEAAPDTSVPSLEPEPAPTVPGLPQFELPTLPPPPQFQLPQLPRIPGL
ncbi:Hsp70 family protein [Rhodococcus rhodochrous]|uniref:Hsp70 family protein n=1 Tax=Rhodococcus rhodochrous TaxID=1829 RepID=UPI001E4C79CE|nr:Hsp70 family protein [Rhodococcus rhodochrous]MCD2099380.1 Hsp70 family protein [Rhodococcus rhodochrous]MCD2123749.1 Hsp70 family protein [Rhodococcus rhodochrous]MCQ4136356.1 Hsp70 family protein [Rhodococcus rhodochrous]MDJ0020648.1 Hsp70 family protein [Rhodococcus rhodochrous]